ncbi:hypothetical protein IDH44_02360 [Paenibacillus sp. IB182496]|uniref:Uncharacterized protein n=1 Tax=Paenibacillus sabuli TaxID=2772509 RepID=A0A927GQ87_9BACL|nr:hypothetical protein [Paenibacillus sabuli]MBD2844021.1 hypothetical protein [Paenibacillus sabuli]
MQKSDTVVSEGRLYRVKADPDGKVYTSHTRPVHLQGTEELDGIAWAMVQSDVTYTAGVRNVTFRNIFLRKARTAFSVHFDNDRFSRSYYPGAPVPLQEQLVFDQVRVLHEHAKPLLAINTPIDAIAVTSSHCRDNPIVFRGNRAMSDYGVTRLQLAGGSYGYAGAMNLVENEVPGKRIVLRAWGSMPRHEAFEARLVAGPGTIEAETDL